MPKSSYAVHLEAYGHLADTVEREASELTHLTPLLETLNDSLDEARAARERQQALQAAAQQATRDFEAAFAKTGQAATQLRLGLRSAYGEKSMKLITFGMRPHRAAWLPKK
jgi:regulator of protease activity HflC (stomatin/prohibitin superfamily)